MKVDLKEELVRDKETLARQLSENSPVNEVRQLLLTESAEDARILRAMGQNSTLMQLENLTNNAIQLEKLEEEYGEVFTRHQIEALAIKYRLRFVGSNNFIGKMDVQVTAMIRKFAKDTNTSIDEHTLSTKFKILAEPSAFNTHRVRVSHFQGAKDMAAFMHGVFVDPVLFYQIDENHFRMIHKWGNDFTIYRLLLGYKWRSPNTLRTFNFFFQLPFIAILMGLLNSTVIVDYPIATTSILLVSSALIAWVRNVYYLDKGGHLSQENTEYFDGFFTPHNWSSLDKLK